MAVIVPNEGLWVFGHRDEVTSIVPFGPFRPVCSLMLYLEVIKEEIWCITALMTNATLHITPNDTVPLKAVT